MEVLEVIRFPKTCQNQVLQTMPRLQLILIKLFFQIIPLFMVSFSLGNQLKLLLLFFLIFLELWEDTDDYPDGVGIHDVASISSSETTESSESFETDNYPRAVDEVKKIFEQENFQKKNKNESL